MCILEKGTLIVDVLDVIEKTGVDPKNLVFEITDSIMNKNQENAISTINELKNIGIKIAIDDFGTGFSSLSY
ncbi:EAL domain-containing protein [Metabacillus bambusae]|uniref:EAL domain-containing protein n=1 Tax=Metabacillus bambusae TaxID=2795218 RepID=A0ABS3MWD1_9BACI|nr:EAL domain-containing protein [Metabacillus bambusae]